MRKTRSDSGIWQYLEASGVLEHGTEEEIKAVRREYRKKYILDYKRKQRKEKREYTVVLKQAEKERLVAAARKHRMTSARFLKSSALAYISQQYLVPYPEKVADIESLLLQTLSEIQCFVDKHKIRYVVGFDQIERTIERLEKQINEKLRYPPILPSSNDHQG